ALGTDLFHWWLRALTTTGAEYGVRCRRESSSAGVRDPVRNAEAASPERVAPPAVRARRDVAVRLVDGASVPRATPTSSRPRPARRETPRGMFPRTDAGCDSCRSPARADRGPVVHQGRAARRSPADPAIPRDRSV